MSGSAQSELSEQVSATSSALTSSAVESSPHEVDPTSNSAPTAKAGSGTDRAVGTRLGAKNESDEEDNLNMNNLT